MPGSSRSAAEPAARRVEVPRTGLSQDQIRGRACVWCGVGLDNGTAVDLGRRPWRVLDRVIDWFPRGCPPCATEYEAATKPWRECGICGVHTRDWIQPDKRIGLYLHPACSARPHPTEDPS